MTAPEADLTGWACEPFSAAGFTHDVYRKGAGPGVVLIPEMPGAHPGVLALGDYLVDNGFTVAIPSLYGTPGAAAVRPAMVPILLRGCVAKEFAAFATNKDRPVSHYLRALARDLKEKTGSKGVGVIGQCFSGPQWYSKTSPAAVTTIIPAAASANQMLRVAKPRANSAAPAAIRIGHQLCGLKKPSSPAPSSISASS